MTAESYPRPLDLERISVTYPAINRRKGPVEALREVSIALQAGVITGLAGPNGAGKTTLMEVCIGAVRPSAGRITWFGHGTLDRGRRSALGFCPDVPAFPPRVTGRELLSFFGAIDGVPRGKQETRIAHLADRLRVGEALDQHVGFLSRGIVQRPGILQALICEPSVLLCDESFAPLDPVAQLDLRLLLREEADRGAAILISSHQLDQLGKVADEIIILSAGQVVARLGPDVVRSRRMLVLGVERLNRNALSVLMTVFPSGIHAGGDCASAVAR
jgi:ABC-type multidrug transport system ATPase subunit